MNPCCKLRRWMNWLPRASTPIVSVRRPKSTLKIILESTRKKHCKTIETMVMKKLCKRGVLKKSYLKNFAKSQINKKVRKIRLTIFLRKIQANFQKNSHTNFSRTCLFDAIHLSHQVLEWITVDRLFSMGRDVLRLKRCRMSDKHFEMPLFLRANKN